jgi:hypothetical protein
MIKDLMDLIKNHDKIIAMLNEYNKVETKVEKKVENKPKAYSTFNTPKDQLEYIAKIEKGE